MALPKMCGPFEGTFSSYQQRHPHLLGARLREQWDKDYVLEDLSVTGEKVSLWTENQETFYRHPRNNRKQKAVEGVYIKFFLRNGWVEDGRSGRYAGVPTTTDRARWRIGLMGGATFMNTMYRLIKERFTYSKSAHQSKQ